MATSALCGTFDAREERGLADRRAREAERLRRIKDPALYSRVDTAWLLFLPVFVSERARTFLGLERALTSDRNSEEYEERSQHPGKRRTSAFSGKNRA